MKKTEDILQHIMNCLDLKDLPYQTRLNCTLSPCSASLRELLSLTHEEGKQVYDSIPIAEGYIRGDIRKKTGTIELISEKGNKYTFIAEHSINLSRTFEFKCLTVERRKPDVKHFCSIIIGFYEESFRAPPIKGDVETIAKHIISLLDTEDNKADNWTLGGSFQAYAEACFIRIPKEDYDSPDHTSAEKGSITVLGDDGLEYLFTAEYTSKFGGSERYDSESLSVECAAIGLSRTLYSESGYYR